jgi:desulfoferrodoxin-like iron-binding protein
MAAKAGQKYVCDDCGATVIVVKVGSGALTCCGKPMSPAS